jgi:hypothetical protein
VNCEIRDIRLKTSDRKKEIGLTGYQKVEIRMSGEQGVNIQSRIMNLEEKKAA